MKSERALADGSFPTPAPGQLRGAAGTVASVSAAGFTMSTSAGQKVTVNEASATTYQKATSPASASAITVGEPVLVFGTTSGTTITATQVTMQPADGFVNQGFKVVGAE